VEEKVSKITLTRKRTLYVSKTGAFWQFINFNFFDYQHYMQMALRWIIENNRSPNRQVE
jgi:translation elongation factor P/translation initiation factor 5A